MATLYFLVKVEVNSQTNANSVLCELTAALDNDNTYRGVERYFVTDINNVEIQAILDGTDLHATETESKL